jgi:hypothetical protein
VDNDGPLHDPCITPHAPTPYATLLLGLSSDVNNAAAQVGSRKSPLLNPSNN